MSMDERTKIRIDQNKEARTKEISNMINEGGLGSRTYYDIEKHTSFPTKTLENAKKKVD